MSVLSSFRALKRKYDATPCPCYHSFTCFQTSEAFDMVAIGQSMASVSFVLELLFLFCYFGNQVTFELSKLSDEIYLKHWYTYPNGIQSGLVMVLMRAQVPFYFKGWHLMPCTLNSFVKVSIFSIELSLHRQDTRNNFGNLSQVVKSAVSAYMLLKSIEG